MVVGSSLGLAGWPGSRDSMSYRSRQVWVLIPPLTLSRFLTLPLTISVTWAIYSNCFLICKMEFSLSTSGVAVKIK